MSSLKSKFFTELIGSLIVSISPGLLYTGLSYLSQNDRFGRQNYSKETAVHSAAIACVLTIVSFPISGAHFTPTITFPMLALGRIKPKEGFTYLIAQAIGYLLGGLALMALVPAEWNRERRFEQPIPRPAAFSVPYYDALDNKLAEANWAKLFGEFFAALFLYFGYFVATRCKQLSGFGVGAVMGLTYFVVVAHSILLSGGTVNPFRIFGYVYSRDHFEENWYSWISVWPLAVSPVIAGIFGEILFSLVFKGKLPFNATVSGNGEQEDAPSGADSNKKPVEEPLVE